MCGRIVQKEWPMDYVETIRWNPHTVFSPPDIADGLRYNVPPGTRPLTLHRLNDGAEHLDRLFWGYGRQGEKAYSNARLDKILQNNGFWRSLFERGRVIVPADGWYEWTGEKGAKEPWFIHASDGDPILFAGISAFTPGVISDAEHGMAIVTDDAAGGMVDIHDRRPIVLTVDDAWEWLDPTTTPEQAKEILMTPRPESAFEWYRVTKAVGNSRYQSEDCSHPL